MYTDFVMIAIAFLEGMALIFSPCILPILPIILSGSLTGQRARALGIITGFIITFTLVTLFSRAIIDFLHINENIIRNSSLIILFLLSVIMMSDYLTEKFNLSTQGLTNVGSSIKIANNPQSGFAGGILFGGLVGIIWTPCAGPILAAVIVQVVLQQTTLSSFFVVLAFAIGAGLPMLLIAFFGRTLIQKFGFLRERTSLLRKFLGFIILLTVIYLAFFPTTLPSFSEMKSLSPTTKPTKLINGLFIPYKAPNIDGISAWINSEPLKISDLKNKVILIDFWTYSCINCLRTLPYLKDWYAKYHNQGLEIIGIHSPEFQFEHELTNVKNAVAENKILYPVALDNNFATWQNFNNKFWPAHYLINKQGEVVYTHFGEGAYEVTENNIRYLLGLKNQIIKNEAEQPYSFFQTAETYFGYDRMDRFANAASMTRNQATNFSYPQKLAKHHWALQGKWTIYSDKIVADAPDAALKFHFVAKKVYAVMGTRGQPIHLQINTVDNPSNNKLITISTHKLYTLVELKNGDEGTLELIAKEPGLEIYTFTFGN